MIPPLATAITQALDEAEQRGFEKCRLIRERLDVLEEAVRVTTDALEKAFQHDETSADALFQEIKEGRWNGVRAHIELNRQLLEDQNA